MCLHNKGRGKGGKMRECRMKSAYACGQAHRSRRQGAPLACLQESTRYAGHHDLDRLAAPPTPLPTLALVFLTPAFLTSLLSALRRKGVARAFATPNVPLPLPLLMAPGVFGLEDDFSASYDAWYQFSTSSIGGGGGGGPSCSASLATLYVVVVVCV